MSVRSPANFDQRPNFGLRFFYVPYIYDTGPTAVFPFRRKSYSRFYALKKIHRPRPGLNPLKRRKRPSGTSFSRVIKYCGYLIQIRASCSLKSSNARENVIFTCLKLFLNLKWRKFKCYVGSSSSSNNM